MEQIKKAWGMATKGQAKAVGMEQAAEQKANEKGQKAARENGFNALVAEQLRKQHKVTE
jgi:hypothetical protein